LRVRRLRCFQAATKRFKINYVSHYSRPLYAWAEAGPPYRAPFRGRAARRPGRSLEERPIGSSPATICTGVLALREGPQIRTKGLRQRSNSAQDHSFLGVGKQKAPATVNIHWHWTANGYLAAIWCPGVVFSSTASGRPYATDLGCRQANSPIENGAADVLDGASVGAA
jgi:hypothetical protein